MKKLNVGCGKVFHEEWNNIDIAPYSRTVKAWDLKSGLPFPNDSFEVVYHSHLLEHLQPEAANKLMEECFRVLKPGGIVRVAVPDLEAIAKNYLDALEQVEAGVKKAEANYDWMMLELYDQTTRCVRGGEMVRFLKKPCLSNKEFIISRVGKEVEILWEQNTENYQKLVWQKLKSQNFVWYIQQARSFVAEAIIFVIAGNNARVAFREGLFRKSGEIHSYKARFLVY